MKKPKYLYDIYDVIEKDYMIVNAYSYEVVEMIDMPRTTISKYCTTGSVFRGRYIVTRKPFEANAPKDQNSDIPKYLQEEFDQVVADIRKIASPERLRRIQLATKEV